MKARSAVVVALALSVAGVGLVSLLGGSGAATMAEEEAATWLTRMGQLAYLQKRRADDSSTITPQPGWRCLNPAHWGYRTYKTAVVCCNEQNRCLAKSSDGVCRDSLTAASSARACRSRGLKQCNPAQVEKCLTYSCPTFKERFMWSNQACPYTKPFPVEREAGLWAYRVNDKSWRCLDAAAVHSSENIWTAVRCCQAKEGGAEGEMECKSGKDGRCFPYARSGFEAKRICSAAGMRLCESSQVDTLCVRNGCGQDERYVWSKARCLRKDADIVDNP